MRKALAILFVLGFGLAAWWLGLAQPKEPPPGPDGEAGIEIAGTWQSGIKVQNLSLGTATVSLQFIDQNGNTVGDAVTAALGPRASREFYLSALPIPNGRYSVVVRSDAPVAAVATQTNYTSGVADSYAASNGARLVSIPYLYRGLDNWYTTVFVQNTDSSAATVRLVAYREGRSPLVLTASVPPRATKAFDTQSALFDPLGTGFRGSAKVSADGDQPLAVTVFHTRLAGAVHILASPRGSEVTNPGTTLALPSLYRGVNGWNSTIQLFNPSTSQTIVATIAFRRDFNWGRGGPWVRSGIVLRPRGSYEFSLATTTLGMSASDSEVKEPGPVEELSTEEEATIEGYLPDGFRGVAAVVANGPIQAQVINTNYGRDMGMGYEGIPNETLTSRLAFPSLYANFGQGPWTSSLRVQNRTDRSVTLNFTFKADDDVMGGRTWRRTGLVLPAMGSVEISMATSPVDGGSPLPAGFRGSAIVEATDAAVKLAGAAIHTNYGRSVANTYTGISF